MANMEDIMRETTALLQRKTASFKSTKKALAGDDPASMPGSEHDSTPPAGSTNADAEVADKTMGPKSTRSAEGGGDDSATTRGHATDATEGEVPPAKPLISGDADAKAANCAKIGNDIMADIRAWRKGAAPKVEAPKVEAPKVAAAPKVEAPKAAAPKVAAPVEGNKESTAGGLNMQLTEKVLAKIAAICLSYEDSASAVAAALEKHAGTVEADEILGFLAEQDAEYTKQAAEAAGYQDGMKLINKQLFDKGVAAGKAASKVAAAPVAAPSQPIDAARIASLLKLGQQLAEQGLGDIMGALPNEQGAPMGAGGMPPMDPAAMAGDPAAAGGDPAAAGAPAAGGEEFSVDDLAAALDVLVSQQQISPEDAQAIMQTVAAGDAGGAEGAAPAPGGMPAGLGEEAAPAPAAEAGESSESGEGEGEEAGEKAEKETPAEESKEGKAKRK